MSKRALIAMSGGVDSSVAACLAAGQGFECAGATMKLFANEDIGVDREKTCCSLEDVEDARAVAYSLGMEYYVFNFTLDFKKQVIGKFISGYQNGATPNPCIDCNRYMKFEKLLSRASELSFDYIVTGHYARIEYDAGQDRHLLKKAADENKDQSYVLYSMTQPQLSRTLLPLGGLCKTEIRQIALRQGFVNAKKRDSQDICFVPGGDYAKFIELASGNVCREGDFVDTGGRVLGRHKGLIHYTIGQRRGLGLAMKTPMYVQSKNTEDNTVTLCTNDKLFSKTLTAADFNWIACEPPGEPLRVKAKIRYSHPGDWAVAWVLPDGKVHIEFDWPQRAIARGQAVVLYDNDIVVGGGTIQ
ncbi:MAG: tRNA 2-thiouridine(34) synthase MnmA [Oscillospiraceae bacterium]|nr:tRNA 2-thiouridine(34) synthase MnmA [Oscillospiraceae bacterium]